MCSPGAPPDPRSPSSSQRTRTEPSHVPPPGPLADASLAERLARWDELPPWDLESLEADPETGRTLAHVKETEAELTGGLDPSESCPSAEELFVAGHGPGAEPLPTDRALEIRAHLDLCPSCAGFVESLLAEPPPPNLLGETRRAPRRAPLRAVRHTLRLVPALAAAVLLVGTIIQLAGGPVSAAWPTQPVLRGAAETDLLFPRDRVLAAETGLDWAASPRFELALTEGATQYRIEVRAHEGAAFDAGTTVLELADTTPTLLAHEGLPIGTYTWEAWVTVDGLEHAIGERDFRIVEDEDLRLRLTAALGLRRVQTLHEAGFLTDARRAALALPASPERDAYLGATPAR